MKFSLLQWLFGYDKASSEREPWFVRTNFVGDGLHQGDGWREAFDSGCRGRQPLQWGGDCSRSGRGGACSSRPNDLHQGDDRREAFDAACGGAERSRPFPTTKMGNGLHQR
ncbi:MAG: hypothetical protein IJX47_01525 [Clostridia bacterium]|nr:hypothetical protein [Clostridia bacterium]